MRRALSGSTKPQASSPGTCLSLVSVSTSEIFRTQSSTVPCLQHNILLLIQSSYSRLPKFPPYSLLSLFGNPETVLKGADCQVRQNQRGKGCSTTSSQSRCFQSSPHIFTVSPRPALYSGSLSCKRVTTLDCPLNPEMTVTSEEGKLCCRSTQSIHFPLFSPTRISRVVRASEP